MARVTSAADLNALSIQREFILTGRPRPNGLHLYSGLVRSVCLPPERDGSPPEREWLDPELQRICLWRDPTVMNYLSIARAVYIDVLGFLIVKVKRGAPGSVVRSTIREKLGFFRIPQAATVVPVPVSKLDVVAANEVSFVANANIYTKHLAKRARRNRPIAG
jgi:hypothetical protein